MSVLLAAVNSKYIHTALGVRALYSYVKSDDVAMREFTVNENLGNVLKEIYRCHAEAVLFSCYIWNIEFILKLAEQLKKLSPDTLIVFGGPEVSFDSVYYMEKYPFIDAVMRGEGEETFADFLENGVSVDGMVYRSGGIVVEMPERPPVCDINTLPFPYTDEDIAENKNKLIYYETSRGCPFRCSYCLSSTVHNVRFRDLEKVKEEIMHFVRGGARIIKFVDRTFNADRKRATELVKFLIKNGGKTQFHFEVAADLLDNEIISVFKTAPRDMFLLEIGVQSTNEATICAVDRKTDFEKICAAVKELKGYVHIHIDLIAGLPYEDLNSFIKSFNDVMSIEPDVLQLGFLKLLRGTKIRNEYKKHDYVFSSVPPYEVLRNEYISYDDILTLKSVEEVLERYYNSEIFTNSLKRLQEFYDTPYDMFKTVADYFEEKGYFAVGISQAKLYSILAELCADGLFKDLLKLDFFMNSNNPSTPKWAIKPYDSSLLKHRFDILTEDFINENLPQYRGMAVKEIIKYVQLERFDHDVLGDMGERDCVLLFDKKNKFVLRCE